MGRFNDFIKSVSPCDPSLPLLHTCDGYHFRNIVEAQELRTSPCKVFVGENLLYFFYGRPSYRTAKDLKASTLLAYFPVSIVLKSDSVPMPKRIAPFDTGAFENEKFSEHMHPGMRREDFLLEPTPDMPKRLVSRFYGSNTAYFSGKPQTIAIPPMEFEATSYYSLISSKNTSSSDDRNSAIEIQSETNLVLDSSKVILIVLPTSFMDDPGVNNRILSDWKCDFRIYETYRSNPNEYIMSIYDEVAKYLLSKSYL